MTRKNIHKMLLLLGGLFLPITHVYAQYEYQPFVKEGKAWHMYGRSDKGPSAYNDFKYLMQGDTVVGGEVMKKVYLIDEVRFHDNSLHYIGAVMEAGKRVYITYAGKDTLMLLYDFSHEPSSQDIPFIITYEDSKIESQIYRIWLYQLNSTLRHFQRGNRYYRYYWGGDIEATPYTVRNIGGIGSTDGMDPFQYWLWGKGSVQMCYEDGACIYYCGDTDNWYEVGATYRSLLKHRRNWEYCEANEETARKVSVLGDTIFQYPNFQQYGWLYRKVYCTDRQTYGDTEQHYYGAMREEGTKVYLVPDGKTVYERQLLFDFGLKKGEQTEVAGNTLKVVETGSTISEGRKYPCLILHQMDNGKDTGRTIHWIEGIGSDRGLLQPLPEIADYASQLVVNDDKTCIYNHKSARSVSKISHNQINGSNTHTLYDLQGRRVTNQPRRGVYIRDGKKVVVKSYSE